MKVSDIYRYIDRIAPFETALGFDNVGLLAGDPHAEVHKIGLLLDVTNPLIEKAVVEGCDLLISHHPLIFDPLKAVVEPSPVYRLIRAGISCISAHTNLDKAACGTNDCMVKALGAEALPTPAFLEELGRVVSFDAPCTVRELALRIKKASGASAVRYYDAGIPVKEAVLVAGSGGSELDAVIANGYQTLITGDIKHDRFVHAENCGVNLIEWNHFDAEHLVLWSLLSLLQQEFDIETVILRSDNILQSV